MKTNALLLILLGMLFTSPSRSQFTWERYGGNPVLPEWSGGVDDPSAYKYAFEPGVLFDVSVSLHRMWFISLAHGFGTRFCVSEAVSVDGKDWYVAVKNPVLQGGPSGSWDEHLRSPKVIFDGAQYKMYYTGWVTSTQQYRIGVATSPDGKTWTRNSSPILPLGPSGSWESQIQPWCDVRLEAGTYTMWYSGSDGTHMGIGVATSSDGITWTKYEANPVFQRSASGWDSFHVFYPMVTKADSTYYMVYRGNTSNAENYSLGLAQSPDGVLWTRSAPNPILIPTAGWEGVSLDGGTLLFRENLFHLWYSALSSTTGHWQSGYATAERGTLGVNPIQVVPTSFSLSHGYPNPFNPETRLRYDIPHRAHVSIRIFDLLGKEVETLVDEEKEPGSYYVHWRPTNTASGVYWCRMNSDVFVESRRVVLLK